jgi:anti-sigma regulatory factor (Ser/Thr protein kinase)
VIELLCTELVTNAIRHADGSPRIAASVSAGRIRVSVHDSGAGLPELRPVTPVNRLGGRGLMFVDELSASWGVEWDGDGGGKTVWFEVDL